MVCHPRSPAFFSSHLHHSMVCDIKILHQYHKINFRKWKPSSTCTRRFKEMQSVRKACSTGWREWTCFKRYPIPYLQLVKENASAYWLWNSPRDFSCDLDTVIEIFHLQTNSHRSQPTDINLTCAWYFSIR